MTEEKNLQQAQQVHAALCSLFAEGGYKYRKDDEQMKIGSTVEGKNGTYSFYFQVIPQNAQVHLILFMPFEVPQEKTDEYSVVITALNSLLAAGCFALDAQRKLAFFRVTNSFYDSILDREVLVQMLLTSGGTVDMVADKLGQFVSGKLDMEQLLSVLEERYGGRSDD